MTSSPSDQVHSPDPKGSHLYALTLGALGVVYGDIGTSPLYALREAFHEAHGILPTPDNIFGVLSLVFWALIIVITLKYLTFILRADNKGEGGVLALTSLVTPLQKQPSGGRFILVLLGLFGTSLLYGDGIITPAISVLSAVEGIGVATPQFSSYVIPITVGILIGIFAVQKHGTTRVGKVFGPVTVVWFLAIATLGFVQVIKLPMVLAAVNPLHGVDFFVRNQGNGFLVLGSVFLVVTGGEALYADMGHFGRKPIRRAWGFLVLPALLLNYFGQGALLIQNPEAVGNPFYRMAPEWALYPLVGIATAATIIASQALISGAFSLTMQAVQLGYLPRVHIAHTSAKTRGQIYIPGVNWLLMIGCIGLVLGFRTSSNLAGAYGVGVTTIMVITTLLFFFVMRDKWHWNIVAALAVASLFLFVDLGFWAANLHKIPHGGWFPLVVGAFVFTLMTTWKKGRVILAERLNDESYSLDELNSRIVKEQPFRVPGTAIYMTRNADCAPPALVLNLRHHHSLHQRIVLLVVETHEMPYVEKKDRLDIQPLGDNIFRVKVRYGFVQEPDIPSALKAAADLGYDFDVANSTFFLGRENLLATHRPGMAIWREKLFAVMSRNAWRATTFYNLPPAAVVEVGSQIEL
ncbi:MAG TPA: potassium transporter Kup [Terriglobales bacterium]|nr:potassium transporter Kup [Terriglobales bacterium]